MTTQKGSADSESVEQDPEPDAVSEESEPTAVHRDLRVSRPPMTGPDVEHVQTLLQERGLNRHAPDGTYSVQTATRVRRFQQQNDLPVTGEVDLPTLRALEE